MRYVGGVEDGESVACEFRVCHGICSYSYIVTESKKRAGVAQSYSTLARSKN